MTDKKAQQNEEAQGQESPGKGGEGNCGEGGKEAARKTTPPERHTGMGQNQQEVTAPPERGAGLKGLRGLTPTNAHAESMLPFV